MTEFRPDEDFARNCQQTVQQKGAALLQEVRHVLERRFGWRDGATLLSSDKTEFMRKNDIQSEREFMVALARLVRDVPSAPVSNFKVSVVGKERETGDLVFGGNLEFPPNPLGLTVHAEQFLFARAFHRGHSIESFALDAVTPCGHCRQFILEFKNARDIRFCNFQGYDLPMEAILPLRFGPEQLGSSGIVKPSRLPVLKLQGKKPVKTVADLVSASLAAAAQSYAPYSRALSGVAIETKDGEIIPGSYIENVAFNPSLSPLLSALINLWAAGKKLSAIKEIILTQTLGAIDQAPQTKALLAVLAPKARLLVLQANS